MGATVIDSLVVELGIDNKRLRQDAQESQDILGKTVDGAKKSGEGIEKSFKSTSDAIFTVRNSLLELFAVFLGTSDIVGFLDNVRQTNTQLGRLSTTTGASVQTLSTWGNAAAAAGGDAQDAYAAFQTLTTNFEQSALTGQATTIPYFQALHVTLLDANGNMKDIGKLLLEMSANGQALHDNLKAAFLFRGAGIPEGMIPMLLGGPEKVREFLQEVKKYSPTAEDVENARGLTEQFGLLEAAAGKAGSTYLTLLAPAIRAITAAMRQQLDWMTSHTPVSDPIGWSLKQAALVAGVPTPVVDWIQDHLTASNISQSIHNNEAPIPAYGDDNGVAWSPGAIYDEFTKPDKAPPPQPPIAAKGLPSTASALLRGIGAAEGATYDSLYGDNSKHPQKFSGNQFPNWSGAIGPTGQPTHAAGRYQFEPGTWARISKKLGLKDFSPDSQDRAALELAQETYKGNLLADLASINPKAVMQVTTVLSSQWAGLKAHPGALAAQVERPQGPAAKPSQPPTAAPSRPSQPPTSRAPAPKPSQPALAPAPKPPFVLPPMGAPAVALAAAAGYQPQGGTTTTSQTETHIGTINVNGTDVKDSSSFALTVGGALDKTLGIQSQGGMQ